MRLTYRSSNIKDYWEKRWSTIPVDQAMTSTSKYPLKYALQTIKDDQDGTILEAGCGAGRLLRYFHERSFNIVGIDYIQVAIEKLKIADETLNVHVADIMNLPYDDQSFQYILAFGLYHNFEKDIDKAIQETFRTLKKGGKVCASFRADNIQTRLTDWYAHVKSKRVNKSPSLSFHKMNLTRREFIVLFERNGFKIDTLSPVENMPLLYKFKFFRSVPHKTFDENKGRKEGYKLSLFGNLLQTTLMKLLPNQFCNIYVMIAIRP